MYQKFYKNSLNASSPLIHMAAHSHHLWPDITREGHLEYYEDSLKLLDNKWDKILTEVLPKSQKYIAQILNLSRPKDISFAPNTHELLYRLISSFYGQNKINILTTDGEFHSAMRQFKRYREWEKFEITFIDSHSSKLEEILVEKVKKEKFDLIFISHVFFQTGKVLNLEVLKELIALKQDAVICVDGYHSFCALPTDLAPYEDHIFFFAGSYKYAQAGEGMCFMTLPKKSQLRPLNTGWFAGFEDLQISGQSAITFSDHGERFAGSTRDFCAHYRFNAVWNQFFKSNIHIDVIHDYIGKLQSYFLKDSPLSPYLCTPAQGQHFAHFLSFDMQTPATAQQIFEELKSQNVLTDYRGSYLRFGFGLYQNHDNVEKSAKCLKKLKLFN